MVEVLNTVRRFCFTEQWMIDFSDDSGTCASGLFLEEATK